MMFSAAFRQPPLFGVIGKPVAHSLSPAMHNAAFAATGINAFFGAFEVSDLKAAIAGVRALGIRGCSVTIPHKIAVIDYLDECDERARRIGAVNTLSWRDGRLFGTNTDAPGALEALRAKLDPAGRRAVVLGSGGAARALVCALVEAGAEVFVCSRAPERGERLAKEFAAAGGLTYAGLAGIACEILINTTPVGMFPQVDAAPVAAEFLRPGMVVMDIVYNPLRTRLLETAAARGAEIVDGLGMFVAQGALQFELWTGRPAPRAVMRRAVLGILEGKGEDKDA